MIDVSKILGNYRVFHFAVNHHEMHTVSDPAIATACSLVTQPPSTLICCRLDCYTRASLLCSTTRIAMVQRFRTGLRHGFSTGCAQLIVL
jgi:hypothetical protein